MEKHTFKFELKQIVKMAASDESGVVIGRAEYSASEPSYQVRYLAGDGRQVEGWWGESAIVAFTLRVSPAS
ncbi:MAG: hypothetical protein FJX45_18260 [Alphaproteobacteria bacterium]|nr:hypothetical protein [Alphaproteobacteria bacterium]MBM3653979.1 hypothetical protein [Alphaproteobacteria bacterium]